LKALHESATSSFSFILDGATAGNLNDKLRKP
jgi:hypothetical protein